MKTCIACSMPLTKPDDFPNADESKEYCIHCAHEDGSMKSGEEVFEGGVAFFMNTTGSSQDLAEKITRKNMKNLAYWQQNPCTCLEGEEASDEEFYDALQKLAS